MSATSSLLPPLLYDILSLTWRCVVLAAIPSTHKALLPPETYYAAHLNIIRHGREVCRALQPRCDACFLTKECNYYREVVIPSKKRATE